MEPVSGGKNEGAPLQKFIPFAAPGKWEVKEKAMLIVV